MNNSAKGKMNRTRSRVTMLTLLVSLLLMMSLTSCGMLSNRYQAHFLDVFDTSSLITGYASSQKKFDEMTAIIHEDLMDSHKLYDIYNDYEGINNLKTVNDRAGIAPVVVDQKIIDLLKFGKDMYQATDGTVNIAMGSVLALWHDARAAADENPGHAALPDMQKLRIANLHSNINEIIIDEQASTVFLSDADMRLDVGGIAKGFAVEHAKKVAEDAGAEHYLLNIGGNVSAIGKKPDGKKWECAIESPQYMDDGTGKQFSAKTELDEMSLVTSGDYERYFMVNDKRYHHIIDPRTLYPSTSHRSVSILTRDGGTADVYSTALFIMTTDEGRDFVDSYNASRPKSEHMDVMWIDADGTITVTDPEAFELAK